MIEASDFIKGPELLAKIDYYNTVHGGVSECESEFIKLEDGYEAYLRAPGIAVQDMTVEVINGRLMVYHSFKIVNVGIEGKSVRVIGNFDLPADADCDQITASKGEQPSTLFISIPYIAGFKNYRRRVDIDLDVE